MATNDIFKRIQVRAQARVQNTGTSTSNANDLLPKVKDWVTFRHDRILRIFPWPHMVRTFDLSVVSGTIDYALRRDLDKVLTITDITNGPVINEETIQSHERFIAPVLEVAGDVQTSKQPSLYRFIGNKSVSALLSIADTIQVLSTSASDITPKVIHVVGEVSGVQVSEDIILTGVSAAESTNTYDSGSELILSQGTNDGTLSDLSGVVTVREKTTTSNTLSTFAPEERAPSFRWIRLSPEPAAALTARIWYKKKWRRLVDDNDIPEVDCANEIIEGVVADALWEDGQGEEAQAQEVKFQNLVTELWRSYNNLSRNLIKQAVPDNGDARQNDSNPLRLFGV